MWNPKAYLYQLFTELSENYDGYLCISKLWDKLNNSKLIVLILMHSEQYMKMIMHLILELARSNRSRIFPVLDLLPYFLCSIKENAYASLLLCKISFSEQLPF